MASTPNQLPFPYRAREAFDYEHDPTWRIFRIMSEFVEGFSFLAHIQRSVTVFGSARFAESSPYYEKARQLGWRLAQAGYTVVTGGGPGIMQAANQGACEAHGTSVGLNIQLPHEQRTNPFVTMSESFHYFFSRKVMLDFSAEAYVFFPGGYGTLDEYFELLTLVQTGKVDHMAPIIMVGTDYWGPLANWMREMLLETFHTISPGDLSIWTLTDDIEQVMLLIETGVQQQVEQRIAVTGQQDVTPNEKLAQATRPMTGTEQ
ncbi:MAG TPA: TIGR00730 family Rossman fold protein [Ktedonobacterales bacterium]|nr:TIGR00730 family Rossman fold protein [Ktedonobacterales bacterium]